jgi:hypothetical protein
MYGARGCIKCGSKKHWDRDCKYWNKKDDNKAVHARYARYTAEVLRAEASYEMAYEEHLLDSGEDLQSDNTDSDAGEAQDAGAGEEAEDAAEDESAPAEQPGF